jgi:hypothetical protein
MQENQIKIFFLINKVFGRKQQGRTLSGLVCCSKISRRCGQNGYNIKPKAINIAITKKC